MQQLERDYSVHKAKNAVEESEMSALKAELESLRSANADLKGKVDLRSLPSTPR
jgi:hypothetical protein